MEKMKFSWKRVRTAFAQLNVSKTGFISREDLKVCFGPWQLSDEQFEWLFNKFDTDKDGKISYNDFSNTIGLELFPQEGLYFRQEKKKVESVTPCKHPGCWQATASYANFCTLHEKMHQEQVIDLYTKWFRRLNDKWPAFIGRLRQLAE